MAENFKVFGFFFVGVVDVGAIIIYLNAAGK